MYSAEGLANWEIVAASGLLALSVIVISALIGSLVAYIYIALREPKVVAKTVSAKEGIQTDGVSQGLPAIPHAA